MLAAFRTALRSFLVGQSLLSRVQSTQMQPNKSWSATLSAQGDIDLKQMVTEYTNTKVRSFQQQIPLGCRRLTMHLHTT